MYGTDETNISKADCYKWSELQNFDNVCVFEKVERNNGTGVTFANKCGEIYFSYRKRIFLHWLQRNVFVSKNNTLCNVSHIGKEYRIHTVLIIAHQLKVHSLKNKMDFNTI